MSEAIWTAGKDPSAMLQGLGAIGERKQRLVAAALVRRCIRLVNSATVGALLDQFDADDALALLPSLRQFLEQEQRDLLARQQRSRTSSAQERQANVAASGGHGVKYPAEVPHAAAAMLDEDAHNARESAEDGALTGLCVALDLGQIDEIAEHVQDALAGDGRATVLSAIAESWRQYADQIAEQTANQPRKLNLLISNAVQYVDRGRQYLDGKVETKRRQVEKGATAAAVEILRDIFGNPFQPMALDPRWLTSTVVDLAQAIFNERAFDRMPVLGDALMDAGCDNNEILSHCRGTGPHVRGCWVVDLVLAK